MSNNIYPLLSVTFCEKGYTHFIELIHQRDIENRKRLKNAALSFFDENGGELYRQTVDTNIDTIELSALADQFLESKSRIMVTMDSRYDTAIFPYRPHHYAFFHKNGSKKPPVYYAINGALGGLPNRINPVANNHHSVFMFFDVPEKMVYSVMVGNLSRFSTVKNSISVCYKNGETVTKTVEMPPKTHFEVPIESTLDGHAIHRVELKGVIRPVGYIVGRQAISKEIVFFDHLFSYLK